jgi:hypothetical protein
MTTSFCQKRYGSLYDRSLERDLQIGFKTGFYRAFTGQMECLSEFGPSTVERIISICVHGQSVRRFKILKNNYIQAQ